MKTRLELAPGDRVVRVGQPDAEWLVIIGELGLRAVLTPYLADTANCLPTVVQRRLTQTGSLPTLYITSTSTEILYGEFGATLPGTDGGPACLTRAQCEGWSDALWLLQAGHVDPPITLGHVEGIMGNFAAAQGWGCWIEWLKLCEIADQYTILGEV